MTHVVTDRRIAILAVLTATAVGFCIGCAPTPRAVPPAGPDEQYTIAVDSPAAAARSALLVMRAELKAVARGDRAAAADHLAALRQRIAALDVLGAEIRRMPYVVRLAPTDAEVAEMASQATGTWSAIIAHYIDGLDLAGMVATEGEERAATVLVPGRGRDGDALIRLRCARTADGSWRVSRVDFVPRKSAATQPTSGVAPPG